MLVPTCLSAVAEAPDARGKGVVLGHHGPPVAKRTQVLGGIEAEGSGNADSADGPTHRGGQMRLTAVLDERQAVSACNGLERHQIRRLTVEMHWKNGARSRRDGVLHSGGRQGEARRVDIGEHRTGSGHHHGQCGECRRERRRDHLVARSDVERSQNEGNGISPVADAHGVCCAAALRELALERFDLRAEHEPPAADHPRGIHRHHVLVQRHLGAVGSRSAR